MWYLYAWIELGRSGSPRGVLIARGGGLDILATKQSRWITRPGESWTSWGSVSGARPHGRRGHR